MSRDGDLLGKQLEVASEHRQGQISEQAGDGYRATERRPQQGR
jgi:hypothetical protein